MLSFLTQTCEQLAEGAAHDACSWAATNPAIALGAAAATLLATTATGLYFSNRKQSTKVPVVPVARLSRQPLNQVIHHATIDQSKLVLPDLKVNPLAEEKMPVQTIVLAELHRQLQNPLTEKVARELLNMRQTKAKEIDRLILRALGLPEDGKMPKTPNGIAQYDQVMTNIAMPHLKLR